MWRARFRQAGTEQWLWTQRTTKTAREALALAQQIASGSSAELVTASGQRVDHQQADHTSEYHAVPAADLGYAPQITR